MEFNEFVLPTVIKLIKLKFVLVNLQLTVFMGTNFSKKKVRNYLECSSNKNCTHKSVDYPF